MEVASKTGECLEVGPEGVSPGEDDVCLVDGEQAESPVFCRLGEGLCQGGNYGLGIGEDNFLFTVFDSLPEVILFVDTETAVVRSGLVVGSQLSDASRLVLGQCHGWNHDNGQLSVESEGWGGHGEGLARTCGQVYEQRVSRIEKHGAADGRPLTMSPVVGCGAVGGDQEGVGEYLLVTAPIGRGVGQLVEGIDSIWQPTGLPGACFECDSVSTRIADQAVSGEVETDREYVDRYGKGRWSELCLSALLPGRIAGSKDLADQNCEIGVAGRALYLMEGR